MDKDRLLSNLAQFAGTTAYYRIAPKLLITDGVKFLAVNAGCYWLFSCSTNVISGLSSNLVS